MVVQTESDWSQNDVRIKRNKNIAKIRLLNKRNSSVREMLIEHFWPVDDWPDHVVNSLMEFKYIDRICVCVCNFFYGNGLQLENAFQVISFYHSWNPATHKMLFNEIELFVLQLIRISFFRYDLFCTLILS